MRVCSGILLFMTVANSTPTITFPINSQVPPVARVAVPFSFTFSASTFTSDFLMTYALTNAPSWLSFDGNTRTLYGIAPEDEANTAPIIEITASDSTGSVIMYTTLVISPDPAPVVEVPLEDQLESFGTNSPPDTILYYVSTPFKFTFDPKTFGDKPLNYYSVTLQNTPLPSWLYFDGSSLTFSGQTPNSGSLVQPPQTFGIQLIGSDVLGFAGAAIPFNIVVGNHKLDFVNGSHTINATIGAPLVFNGLGGTLLLDDQPVDDSAITSINATIPEWLTFDKSTFVLSGTPPLNASSYNVTITATDIYGDVASAIVEVQIAQKIFSGPLGSINATIGKSFSKNLTSVFSHPEDVTVSAEIDPASPWLSLDSQTLILSGFVPSDAEPSTIQVVVNATSRSTHESEAESLALELVKDPHTTTSSSTSSPTSTTAVAEKTAPHRRKGLTKGEIAAIVILPILFIIALLICLCCYKRRKYLAETRPISPQKEDVSRPMSIHDTEIAVDILEKKKHRHQVNNSNTYTDTTFVTSKRYTGNSMRRTQTESAISFQSLDFRDSRSTSARARSFSANAISEYGSSFRSTQDSAYPPLPGTRASERMTRNFSRKTNGGSLGRDDLSEFPMRQSELACAPLRRLSKSSIQQTPNVAYDAESIKMQRDSRRRFPRYLGAAAISKRFSGIGHGSRQSASGLSFTSDERRSAGLGHGTLPIAFESSSDVQVVRNVSSWQTIEPGEPVEPRRHSNLSALTESTDVLDPAPMQKTDYLTVRKVPKSPATLRSRVSLSSGGSRADSRRAVGNSPFFAGSSRSGSSREPRRKRKSLPRTENERPLSKILLDQNQTQESLEQSILRGLRDVEPRSPIGPPSRNTEGLGISYDSPREGTKHLQNLVSEISIRMNRAFHNSHNLSDDDSRFRSADPSPVSKTETQRGEEEETYAHEHFGYSPQGQRSVRRVGQDESFMQDVQDAGGLPEGQPSLLPTFASLSNPNTPNLVPPLSAEVEGRFMPGPGRPISIDTALSKKKSFTASRFSGVQEGGSDDDNDANGSGNVAFL